MYSGSMARPCEEVILGEAEKLVSALHRQLLSTTSDAAGKPFQGLREAARYYKKSLSTKSHRHLTRMMWHVLS